MAVQEQTPLQEYTANGIAKQFDLEFDCESADHLIVSIDDLEVLHTDWYLSGNAIMFHVAPANGKQVKIQRNTPFNRLADYQSYNNSFRPPAINKDFDRIWWKLQELGVADWILSNRIDALKNYVDDRDDELRAYLMEEIRKQGVALDQLDDYYNYLMQRLAQIAVDKGWDASFVVDASGKTQQEINDSLAGVGKKIDRDLVSVWDFFTDAELEAYKSAPANMPYDATHNIQNFFDHITTVDVGIAYFSGAFFCMSPLVFGKVGVTTPLTQTIVGSPIITYGGAEAIDDFIQVYLNGVRWAGSLSVGLRGINAINYDRRFVRTGVRLGGRQFCTNFFIDGIYVNNGAKEFGLVIDDYTTASNIGKIRATRHGCGYSMTGYEPTIFSNFTTVSTTAGTTNQRSIIEVDSSPDVSDDIPLLLEIDNQLYVAVGRPTTETPNQYGIFPSLPSTTTSSTVRWIFGGGVYMRGGDASVINIGNISSSTCGISLYSSALYPPTISSLTTQGNRIGVVFGNSLTAAHEHGTIGELYLESLAYQIVQVSRFGVSVNINNCVELDMTKCVNLGNWRINDTVMAETYKLGVATLVNTSYTPPQKIGTGSDIQIDMNDFDTDYLYAGNASTARRVNLVMAHSGASRLFGVTMKRLIIDSSSGSFTGSVTFSPPPNVTLNGSTSDLVFTGVMQFLIIAYNSESIHIKPIGQKITQSFTYNFASIETNTQQSFQVTMQGVQVGDAVAVSANQPLQGTRVWAEVTSENTVTIYHRNDTGAVVDLPSISYTLRLI